jgi:PAS domain-containing protein
MASVLPELVSYLEGLPEPHILFDKQYRIVAANAAYRRQFSPQAAVIGRTCHEVSHHFSVPCDQAGESCPMARARESGHRERVLHLHHTPQGEAYVNIELAPLRDATNPDGGDPLYRRGAGYNDLFVTFSMTPGDDPTGLVQASLVRPGHPPLALELRFRSVSFDGRACWITSVPGWSRRGPPA